MKKLTKKHIISIVIVVVLALTITGIALGAKANQKNNDKKVESVEKEKEEKKEEVEDEEVSDEVEAVVDETAEETPTTDTTQKNETTTNNNTTNKNTTANKVTTSKPSSSQQVTQPTPSHVHNWTEVKTQVAVPETGHYETIFEWRTKCCECDTDLTHLTKDEQDAHFYQEPCRGGIQQTWRQEAGQKWVVDTPATTEARVVGYKCSCGATREKTQYAGMYSIKDQASWDALERCKTVFRNGLVGEGSTFYETSAEYGYWESVVVCNSSSNGAWMWIFIRDWKLDDYSYLQDSVREGIIDQEEAKQVQALYEEIPSIFKRTIESIAPQGGTEVYNYAVNLISQAGGNLDKVPSLAGAQGNIPENIPGLYVTIEELRGGFALMFWAE